MKLFSSINKLMNKAELRHRNKKLQSSFFSKWSPAIIGTLIIIILLVFGYIYRTLTSGVPMIDKGFFIDASNNVIDLKNRKGKVYNLNTKNLEVGDAIYKTPLGSYFDSRSKSMVNIMYPYFVNDGITIINYNEKTNLVNENLARFHGYKGMILSQGKLYDDFGTTQMDQESYLAMAYENGIIVNLYDVRISNGKYTTEIPVNSLLYIKKDSISYFERNSNNFLRKEIRGLDGEYQITFHSNDKSFSFSYDKFLTGFGTIDMSSIIEVPVEDEKTTSEGDYTAKAESLKEDPDFVWKKPAVEVFNVLANVYSMSGELLIDDTAGVIVKAPTFTFIVDDKVQLRRSFYNSGEFEATGLAANTTYEVIGQYTYLDEDMETKKIVTFYHDTINTRDLSDLEKVNISYEINAVYSRKIELQNFKIVSNLDDEALKGVLKASININGIDYYLSRSDLAKILSGEPVTIDTGDNLKSNSEYDFEVKFYDRGNNEIALANQSGHWHTCKIEPSVSVRVDEREVDFVKLNISLRNDDNVDLKNYRYIIYDSNGSIVQNGDAAGELTIYNLNGNSVYKIKLIADYDIGDGNGLRENVELGAFDFTTLSIASLGYLNVYLDRLEISHDYVKYKININLHKTNAILARLTTEIHVGIYHGDNFVKEIVMSDDDLLSLRNGDATELVFDGLMSNSDYELKVWSIARQGDEDYKLDAIYNKTVFTTHKKPAEVIISNVFTTENMTDFDVEVYDPDGAIINDYIRAEFRDPDGKIRETIKIDSRKEEPTRITFENLTKDQTYKISFYADEYNETTQNNTYKTHYELLNQEITTEAGISGSIELISSKRYATAANLVDVNSTAKWIENANSGTIHHTVDSNNNVHIKTKTSSSTYIYDLSDYMDRMVKATFKIKAVVPASGTNAVYFTNYLTGTTSGNYSYKLSNVSTEEWTTYTFIYKIGSYMSTSGSNEKWVKQTSSTYGKNYNAGLGFHITGSARSSEYMISDFQVQLMSEEDVIDEQSSYEIETGYWETNGTKKSNTTNIRLDKLINAEKSGWYTFAFCQQPACDVNEYRAYFRVYNEDGKSVYANYGYVYDNYTVYIPAGKKIGVYFIHADGTLEPRAEQINFQVSLTNDDGSFVYEDFSYELLTKVKVNLEDKRNEITGNDYYIRAYNGDKVFYEERYVEIDGENTVTNAIKTIRGLLENTEYKIELGIIIRERYYAIDSFMLSTNDESHGISNINEFRWIQPYGSYVIGEDIDFGNATFYLGYDLNEFNGSIDFQGHTITVNTDSYSNMRKFYKTGKNAVFKNLVLDIHLTHDTGLSLYGFAEYFRGTMDGLYLNIYDDRESTTYDNILNFFAYSMARTAKISHFVIELHGDLHVYDSTTILAYYNSGKIADGYVFGGNLVADTDLLTGNTSRNVSFIMNYGYITSLVEDVYVLGGIDFPNNQKYDIGGIVAYETYGKLKNIYVVGETNPNYPSYGPVLGYSRNAATTEKIYFVADHVYTSSKQERIYEISLNDIDFETSVLSESEFEIREMVELGYYPHVRFSDTKMPAQKYISLPQISRSDIDIVDIEILEKTDNDAKIQMIINNPHGEHIDNINIQYLTTQIEDQTYRDGNSYVTLSVSDPEAFKSKYVIKSIKSSFSGRYANTKEYLEGEKYLVIDFYKDIWTVEDWIKIKNDTSSNYSIRQDLDFEEYSNYTIGTFTGKIKGNNHTISHVYVSSNVNGMLIGNMYGSISDVFITDAAKTRYGNTYNALFGNTNANATFSNIHASNIVIEIPDSATGSLYIGGLVANSNSSHYINCSVTDVKITSNAELTSVYAGGLVGRFYSGEINNAFVQGVDISIYYAAFSNGIGGLVGSHAATTDGIIENAYAIGKIKSDNANIGGIAGCEYGYINNVYTSVDVSSSIDLVGGITGYLYDQSYLQNALFLGSVYSYYSGGFVHRGASNTLTEYDVYASADSLINGFKTIETNGEILIPYENLLEPTTYTSVIGLGNDFDYNPVLEGYLPQLYYANTNELLPNQQYHKIHEEILPVKSVQIDKWADSADLRIILDNPMEYTVTGIEIDDTDIDSFSATNFNGETIVSVKVTPKYYYDSYKLSKIYFEKNGENASTDKSYKIDMIFYRDIWSVEDWQRISKTASENYILRANLDFSNVENINNNVTVNRLTSDSSEQIRTIKGIKLDYTSGKSYQGLIRRVISEINDIKFEDIIITDNTKSDNSYINIINIVYGMVDNIVLNNITIEAPNKNYVAAIGRNEGKEIKNIQINDVTIVGKKGVASLLGYQRNQTYRWLDSFTAQNVHIKGADNYVGGIIGLAEDYYNNGQDDFSKNMSVSDSEITGAKSYTGGIVGYGDCSYCKIERTTVNGGTEYTGGIAGYGRMYYQRNNQVIDSNISGSSYVGGLYGWAYSVVDGYIAHSKVYGNTTTGYGIGGIKGTGSGYSVSNAGVYDVEITGLGNRIGGIVGQITQGETISSSYVKDSAIHGYSYVGGVVGHSKTGRVNYTVVGATSVTAENTGAGGLFGYINNAAVEDGYFMGNMVQDVKINATSQAGGFVGIRDAQYHNPNNIRSNYFAGDIRTSDYTAGIAAGGEANADTIIRQGTGFYKESTVNGTKFENIIYDNGMEISEDITNWHDGYINGSGEPYINYSYPHAAYSDLITLEAGKTYNFEIISDVSNCAFFWINYYDMEGNNLGSGSNANGYVDRYFTSTYAKTGSVKAVRDVQIRIILYYGDKIDHVRITHRDNSYHGMDLERQLLDSDDLRLYSTWVSGYYSANGKSTYDISKVQMSTSYYDFSPINADYDAIEIKDLSGNGANGIAYVSGASDEGMFFNGTDDYIDISNYIENGTAFTLTATYRHANTQGGYIFYYGDASSDSAKYGFGLNMNTYEPYFKINESTTYSTYAYTPVQSEQTVTISFDGITLTSYINGRKQNSRIISKKMNISNNMIARIGASVSSHFLGVISSVKVYGRVLSEEEVAIDYSMGNGLMNGLKLYYDLTQYGKRQDGNYPIPKWASNNYSAQFGDMIPLPVDAKITRGNLMSLSPKGILKTGNGMFTQDTMDAKYHIYASGVNTLNIEFDQLPDNLSFSYKFGDYQSDEISANTRVYTIGYNYSHDITFEIKTPYETINKTFSSDELRRTIMIKDDNYYHIDNSELYVGENHLLADIVNIYDGLALSNDNKIYNLSTMESYDEVTDWGTKEMRPLFVSITDNGHIDTYYNFSVIVDKENSVIREMQVFKNDSGVYVYNYKGRNNNFAFSTYNTKKYQLAISNDNELLSLDSEIKIGQFFDETNIIELVGDPKAPIMMVKYMSGKVVVANYQSGEIIFEYGNSAPKSMMRALKSYINRGMTTVATPAPKSYEDNLKLTDEIIALNKSQISEKATEEPGRAEAMSDYVAVYNESTNSYKLYNSNELLATDINTVTSKNDLVASDELLYSYLYDDNNNKDSSIENYKIFIYSGIITLVIINLGLFIHAERKKYEK